ncbi:LamG-like jellyroll fold domain-containing protein [Haloferula rosea]|uniref:Uncharacterized protein n=1 Tax=Haloferula rosea TaxID=490093 RepID=A0A934VGR4_9BACT|nr:LamG-like jellyroll fold domain-containing protein [Haloferula rosea]MBK1827855.1 hypothetical protein [Haloferula rosea]
MKTYHSIPIRNRALLTGLSASLLLSTYGITHAATMSQIPDIPTTDILLARGDEAGSGGGSSQATFGYRNADAANTEGTRGRGQSFVINSAPGATYDISGLSVALAGGAGTAIRPDGDLLLTVFEFVGTGATAADQANDTDDGSDWRTKTGGTSGTVVFSGSFEVPAGTSFNGNSLLSFAFDPGELQLDDDKAYGFFMQYVLDDVTGLGADVTIAFNADLNASGNPAGTLLNTNPSDAGLGTGANGSSTTRDLNYFIQGVVSGAPSAPSIVASDTLIELGNSVDLDITFDPSVDTAILTIPSGSVDLVALDDGITNGDPVAGDGEVSVTDSPTSAFDYVVTSTKSGFPDGTANVEVLVVDPSAEPSDNAFSTAIKGDSPLFYYRFEEAAGTGFLLDSSGNGNHTSGLVGAIVQGESPGGMQLAARSDLTGAITVPAASEMSDSFTFASVINVDSFEGGALRNLLAMANDGSGGVGRSILYYGNGGFTTFISGSAVSVTDVNAVLPQTSCLIHMVYDADPDADPGTDDQEVRFYVNGQPYGSPVALPVFPANFGEWVLCSNKNLGSQSHVGFIDETAIFDAALSDVQIAAHGTAFLSAADPLLGFISDTAEITSGDSVLLTWKTSDQASVVTINGTPVDGGAAGGVYTMSFSPTADTTYTINVDGVTRDVSVTVLAPPAPPSIVSISVDDSTPPMVTLVIKGAPEFSYDVQASADLADGFPTNVGTIDTDINGDGSITFEGFGPAEFYRVETP